MKLAFFTSLVLGSVTVDQIAQEYVEWSLGLGRFSRHRPARLNAGVPRSLTVEGTGISGDHHGENDCLLSIRRAEGVVLLRLVQRDSSDGSIFWHNIIRLSANGSGVRIEHAIGRSAPRGWDLAPKASAPTVVQEIITAYSRGGVDPRDLYTAKIICNEAQEVTAFFDHVLIAGSRRVPLLVVTPAARTGTPVVDAAMLAKQLRGMATLVELRTRACAEELTDHLAAAGFDRQFSCFDAGVRLYAPKLANRDPLYRHPLWIRTWLLDLAPEVQDRTELLAGLVASRIAEAAMPADLVTCVQDFDRQERRRRADQVLAAPPPDPAASLESILSQSTEQMSALEAELRGANELVELYDATNRDLSEQIEDAKNRIAEIEYEAQHARLKAETLQLQLDAKQHREVSTIPTEVRADLAASLLQDVAPEVALRLVATAWPERVIVLESALRSAKQSASFARPGDALKLLTTLATEYYDALQNAGDHEARKVFGKHEYASKESETVMGNKAAVRKRTFNYKGEPTEMFAHLKIGTKDSVAETLRVHFHWDSAEKKIVIGHCGPHLDFD